MIEKSIKKLFIFINGKLSFRKKARRNDIIVSAEPALQSSKPPVSFAPAAQPAPLTFVVSPASTTSLHPLVLAYVGDSVYELHVRRMLAQNTNGSVHKLHVEATKHARCDSQADVLHSIMDELTEPERDIVRRGRNAHSGYVPKNANVTEYRYATGFEALIGYLYLNDENERLTYLLDRAVYRVAENDKTQARAQTKTHTKAQTNAQTKAQTNAQTNINKEQYCLDDTDSGIDKVISANAR